MVSPGRLVSQTPMATALVIVAHILADLTVCFLVAHELVPGIAFVLKNGMIVSSIVRNFPSGSHRAKLHYAWLRYAEESLS